MMRPTETSQNLSIVLFWTILSWTLVNGYDNPPQHYFGGVFNAPSDCNADQQSRCDVLCPGDQLDSCSKSYGTCYCHIEPPMTAGGLSCRYSTTIKDGNATYAFQTLEQQCQTLLVFFPVRSSVDIYVCTDGTTESCFFQDFLEEIPVFSPFGGVPKIGPYSCFLIEEKSCKSFCGEDTYAGCYRGAGQTFCYCHTPSPETVNEPPTAIAGFTCHPTDTVTPTSVPKNENPVTQDQICFNAAIGFPEEIEVNACPQDGKVDGFCIFQDQPGGPFTTTEASLFGNLDVSGCDICDGSGFFFAFVCPVVCIVVQVVRVVIKLLKNTLFGTIGNLFDTITETVGGLVGALGLD